MLENSMQRRNRMTYGHGFQPGMKCTTMFPDETKAGMIAGLSGLDPRTVYNRGYMMTAGMRQPERIEALARYLIGYEQTYRHRRLVTELRDALEANGFWKK